NWLSDCWWAIVVILWRLMWFVSAEVYPRWFTLTITRSLAQGSACKDLGRNDQSPGHHVQGRLHADP
ncbi:hypothetical protein, partial [Lacticaseibacillus rhamnosus]|uniref:hypothetical protein n=1 Tax=Lacticaseibacillus rhamnosus TaxID=47715 RepID=UPI002023137C